MNDRSMKHLIEEFIRMKKMEEIIKTKIEPEKISAAIGALYNESYKTSTEANWIKEPQIDLLRDAFLSAGSYGFRAHIKLKYCIAIVPFEQAEKIREAVIMKYYLSSTNKTMMTDNLENTIIITSPHKPCCILDPQYEIWF